MKRILLALCLLACAGCSMDAFLFDPRREDYAFSRAIIPESNTAIVTLMVGGRRVYGVHAFHVPASPSKLLYFHGNYQSLNHYFKWIEIYWELGFDVFAVDYEGYGRSEGTPSEEALIRDAEAAFQFATGDLGWNRSNTVIYGYSLGSIPAVDISAKYACRLLFLEAPIGDADGAVAGISPLDIPGAFVVVRNYSNVDRIKASRNPLIVIQGTADRTLPWELNGKRVYDAATVAKRFRWLDGAGHGDIPNDIGRENYKALLMELMAGW
jgi:pimeloyl-ACP methyl ester carboxylesterase